MQENVYIGTELKFKVSIVADGFSMSDDDFSVEIVRGDRRLLFEKDDLVRDGDDFYCCFDTAYFGTGYIQAIIRAYVPDDDFDDGIRTEVYKFDLLKIERV